MTDDRNPAVPGYFVTGTDTGVGKTLVACGLVSALRNAGLEVAVMKPVASGCRETPGGLRSEDAERLLAAASVDCAYAEVNPFAFQPPVAPHLAARGAGRRIDLAEIRRCFDGLARRADAMVVEGVGGWLVPLNERETVADLAAALGLPVVLVVGMRLGCINHACLSAESIRASGLALAGWIANCIDPAMALVRESIAAISERVDAPAMCVVPHLGTADAAFVGGLLGDHLTRS